MFTRLRVGRHFSPPTVLLISSLAIGVAGCRTPQMTGETPPLNEQLCIEPSQVRVATGRTITLIATECVGPPMRLPLTWTSSDPEVASVIGSGERGFVTGLFPGRSRIRVTDARGATASVTARVGGQ